jgi:short-subunit dehydrogenase
MEINDKIVLVTGASSGMGAAIALEMAKAGADKVLLLARNEGSLKKVASEIESSGGKAKVYPIDLTKDADVAALAQRIISEVGVPDILINNAGSGQWKYLEDTTIEEARQMMDMPYFATFNITRAFLPGMLKRNTGHIVNMSSVASRFVWPGATAYTAARWAIRGFTEALRADLYGTGIGVTLFESGYVKSPYWENNPGSLERIPKIANYIPPLTSEQVGKAIVAGVRSSKRLVVIPFMMKVIYVQHFFLPWVVQWLMIITGYRRKKS